MRVLSLLFTFLAIYGCNDVGTAKFEELSTPSGGSTTTRPPSPYSELLNFDGITSIEAPHPTKAIVHWSDTENAALYEIYLLEGGSETLLSQLSPPADQFEVNDLEEGANYEFKIIAFDEEGRPAENQTVTSHTAPECPENYLKIAGSPLHGTNDFCVMKYEAKDVGGMATSQPSLTPWANITRIDAYSKCDELNDFYNVNAKYELISNAEWMTIANELESNPQNWSGGAVGSGSLNRGRISTGRLPVDDPSDPYSNTSDSGNWDKKRTFVLDNGDEIWDFAGNVWEAVDWEIGGGLEDGPAGCATDFRAVNTASCAGLAAIDYRSLDPSFNDTQKVGHFFGDGNPRSYRGGGYYYGTASGIYALGFAYASSWKVSYVGFRCVYRP